MRRIGTETYAKTRARALWGPRQPDPVTSLPYVFVPMLLTGLLALLLLPLTGVLLLLVLIVIAVWAAVQAGSR